MAEKSQKVFSGNFGRNLQKKEGWNLSEVKVSRQTGIQVFQG